MNASTAISPRIEAHEGAFRAEKFGRDRDSAGKHDRFSAKKEFLNTGTQFLITNQRLPSGKTKFLITN